MATGEIQIKIGDEEYFFDPVRVANDEAMLIERTCGCTFTQWQKQLEEGSVTALTALVWLLRRRNGQTSLKFTDVHFDLGDFDINTDEPGTEEANPTDGEEVTISEEPVT
jgi:hypothetical protein